MEDKIANTGRFHVIKNRFGPDGLTFPAKVNTNTGAVEIYESSTVDGKQQTQKMKRGKEVMKRMLKNKYEDLIND